MKTLRTLWVIATTVALAVLANSHALAVPPNYLIYDIGLTDPAHFASQGDDASPILGIATGQSAGSYNQAFSWNQDDGLFPLPNDPSRTYCRGNGVNDLGVVVGTGATTFFGSSPLPLIWEAGVVGQLPLPAGQTLGRAEDINNNGVAVGSVNGGSLQRAAVYSGGSAYAVTTTTDTGVYANTFYAVNDVGLAVGSGWDPNNAARTGGFVYDIDTDTAYEVDLLPGLNSALNFAVSNAGHVTGTASINSGASAVPFVWTATNGSQEIPLPLGASTGGGRGVNSHGWVVGNAGGVYAVPFLWDGEATYRIQDLVPLGTNWDMSTNTSSSAQGISDCGIIVGTGVLDGDIRAYALVPDDVIATLLQEFLALGRDDGIEIQWELWLQDGAHSVVIERGVSELGPWETVDVAFGTNGTMLDDTAEPGMTYYYRLRISDNDSDDYVLGMVSAERMTVGALGVVLGVPAPNPTRNSTSAAYRLPMRQNVRITVHDVRGRLVRTVVDGSVAGGEHVMQWDGRDDGGMRAPAGVYFVNMQTAQGSRAQRVVLTR